MSSLTVEQVIEALRAAGCKPVKTANGWAAKCPAHEDRNPSLSVSGSIKPLLYCHTGCNYHAILRALGLGRAPTTTTRAKIVATYDYLNADGELLYQVVRFEPKDFRQRRPNSSGGWTWKTQGVQRVLYRLPQILAADIEAWVIVVEGEKDVHTAEKLGFVATCNDGGAGKWGKLEDSALWHRKVAVVPDGDQPGADHALDVARRLHGKAQDVRIVHLPEGVKDLSAWPGSSREELLRLIEQAPVFESATAPEPTPEPTTPARKAVAQADELVRLALEAGEVWRSPGGVDGEAFVSLNGEDAIRRNMPIRSRAFRHWLSGAYYRNFTKAPGSQPVADALVTLSGIALHEGREYPAPVRVHGNAGEVWLDLGDATWQVVHIDAAGWRIRPRAEGPRFVRPKGLQPLHAPVPGGDWQELRELLNIDAAGEHWPLIVAWLCGCMMPAGPYPVLILEGEQGSGKSTAARMLKGLVDSNSSPLRRPPRDERDLMIAASNGWVIAFDNVSGLPPHLCDALCTLATGGGFSTRQLYSDADEQLFDAQRPVLINGIDAPSTRPDLLDRAVRVVLPAIPEDARRTEGELLGAFNAARPKLLGLLCTAAQTAIRRRNEVQLDRLPRMADWAAWVVACEPALDLAEGAFLNAFHENRLASVNVALEASAIAGYLIRLADGDDYTGTAAELLAWLNAEAADSDRHRRDWPTSPALLSKSIRRISPELRRLGIDVTFAKERAGRLLTIARTPF